MPLSASVDPVNLDARSVASLPLAVTVGRVLPMLGKADCQGVETQQQPQQAELAAPHGSYESLWCAVCSATVTPSTTERAHGRASSPPLPTAPLASLSRTRSVAQYVRSRFKLSVRGWRATFRRFRAQPANATPQAQRPLTPDSAQFSKDPNSLTACSAQPVKIPVMQIPSHRSRTRAPSRARAARVTWMSSHSATLTLTA